MLTRTILAVCAFWLSMASAGAQEFSKVSHTESDSASQYVLPELLDTHLDLTTSEKERLYTLYRRYFEEQKKVIRCSYYTLNNLARAAATIANTEAFECLNIMMVSNQKQMDLKRYYFDRIAEEVNGTAALAFQNMVKIRLVAGIAPAYGYSSEGSAFRSAGGKRMPVAIRGRETFRQLS